MEHMSIVTVTAVTKCNQNKLEETKHKRETQYLWAIKMTTEELDGTGTLLSLFKVHLNRKLMACTDIKIWQDDGLPAHICSRCVSKLHIAYQFKKSCEKSDARLRIYIENVIEKRNKPCQDVGVDSKSALKSQVEVQQHQQTLPSLASSIPLQNNYVYIECNANVSEDVSKQFNNGLTTLVAASADQTSPLTYNLNPINVVGSLSNNGYSIHHLNLPDATVQYQTYSVPMQMGQSNNIVPITQQISSVPLQPIANNLNRLVTNEPLTNDLIKPLEVSRRTQTECKTDRNELQDVKSCSTCGKIFPTANKLSRHMKTHSLTFIHRCKICHKGFTHGGNFKVHMRMHNDERPFSCTICDHRCRQLQDLEKHKRKHNGEKPYICRYCNKGFSTSSNLISHERIHTSEKPYVCSICQKAFCQSNELTKHFRTHTHEKSHICKVCNKGFNGSSTLSVHIRSHTGEKPHICHFCNRGFTQSSCLKVHLKRHKNEDKSFQCDQCPRIFISNSSLKEHIEVHLNDDNIRSSIECSENI